MNMVLLFVRYLNNQLIYCFVFFSASLINNMTEKIEIFFKNKKKIEDDKVNQKYFFLD